jgi:hypothetical protein
MGGAAALGAVAGFRPDAVEANTSLPKDYEGWMKMAKENPEFVLKNIDKVQGTGKTYRLFNLKTNVSRVVVGETESRSKVVTEALQHSPDRASWDRLADRMQASVAQDGESGIPDGFDSDVVFHAFRAADPMYMIRNIDKTLLPEDNWWGRQPFILNGEGPHWTEFICSLIRHAQGSKSAVDQEVKTIYDRSKPNWTAKCSQNFDSFISDAAANKNDYSEVCKPLMS